jgi:monovalent cation/proton antiporter MnhG/PhaG subunit
MSIVEILGASLMLAGAALSFLAALGVVDFPSSLARMHAATKSASLGLGLLALGAGLAAGSPGLIGMGALVAVFMFMTAPISGHMLGRAVYAAGQVTGLVHDDLAAGAGRALRIAPEGGRRVSIRRLVLLAVVWVLLWRDSSPGVWLTGLGVAFVIEWTRGFSGSASGVSFRGLVPFLSHYLWTVLVSNVRVAREVVTPNNDQIREAIVAVPLHTDSMAAALLIANAISFTPGSLTIELTQDPLILYVHVLHFESVAAVHRDVARLEELVVAAVAGRAAPIR